MIQADAAQRRAEQVWMARRRRLFDIAGVVAMVVMVVFFILLVRHHGAGLGELGAAVTQDELEAGFREGFLYHGMYVGGDRVGRLYTEQRRQGDGYRIRSEMELAIAVGGSENRSKMVVDSVLDASFRLQSFAVEGETSGLSGTAEGQWDGDDMVITLRFAGEEQVHRVRLPEAPMILPSLRGVLARRGLEPGTRTTQTFFDPMRQANVEADIIYHGTQEILVLGQTLQAHRFEESFLGQRHEVYVNDLGEVLREDLPLGMQLLREPKAESDVALELTPMEVDLSSLGGLGDFQLPGF